MRVLVTGACGFVGGYLLKHLVQSGDDVVGTFLGSPHSSHPSWSLPVERVTLDLTDQHGCIDLVNRVRPEVIYHLAGIAFVPEAEENFDRVLKINVGATNNLARACHILERKTRFLFVSSAEVYGRIAAGDLPISEQLTPNPANNYSLTKLMAELVTKRYQQGGYVQPLIARPFNHIGPGQDYRFVASSFARQLAAISLGLNPPEIKVGNLEARRYFSDVRDIVRGYRLLALRGEGIYNLGSGKAVPVQQILDTLIKVSGLSVQVVQDQSRMRAAEVPEVFGSCARAERELGWRPEIALERSLHDMFDHWVKVLHAEKAAGA